MNTTTIPPIKKQLHSYTWKRSNPPMKFNSVIALMNYLIANGLVEVTERQYPKCQYCGMEIRGSNEALLIAHIYNKHRDKISLK